MENKQNNNNGKNKTLKGSFIKYHIYKNMLKLVK